MNATVTRRLRWSAWTRVACFAAVALLVILQGRSLTSVVLLTTVWAISAVGLSLVLGLADQPALCQASFMLVGAFAYGWVASPTELGMHPVIATAGAVGAGAALALIVTPVLRVRGYTFAIATIAVALLVQEALGYGAWLPGGELGILDVPPVWGESARVRTADTYALIATAVLGAVLLSAHRRYSRGHRRRELAAVAHDPDLLAHFGSDPVRRQQAVFVIAGALGGLAGSLHAGAFGFVQLESFGLEESFVLAVAVVIGGRGRLAGAVAGAFLFEASASALGSGLSAWRPVALGAALIATMHWWPAGLLPTLNELGLRGRTPGGDGAATADGCPSSERGPDDVRIQPARVGVHQVIRCFGALRAVDGAHFELAAGTSTGLIGPNGAGKSTLLDVLGGVRPDGGSVVLDDVDVTRSGVLGRSRAGVVRTFQEVRLVPGLLVKENVLLGADAAARRFGPWTEAQRLEVAELALRRVGLSGIADRPVTGLDLTGARLVELARVLAARPRLALLDEPSSGLDPSDAATVARAVRELHASGCTIVVVEHDLSFLGAVTDDVVTLVDGRTGVRGGVDAVLADDGFRRAYLGGVNA